MSIPCSILSRASTANFTSLAVIYRSPPHWSVQSARGLDNAQQVGLLHDQIVFIIDPDLGARPLAEQHPVTWCYVEPPDLAALVPDTWTDGYDLALLRLFLGGIRDDYAPGGLAFLLDAADHDAIVEWTELHRFPRPFWWAVLENGAGAISTLTP